MCCLAILAVAPRPQLSTLGDDGGSVGACSNRCDAVCDEPCWQFDLGKGVDIGGGGVGCRGKNGELTVGVGARTVELVGVFHIVARQRQYSTE